MSCGIGRRRSSDPVLLWLWCRLAAVAPIRLVAWEIPHATLAALEGRKKIEIIFVKRKKKKRKKKDFVDLKNAQQGVPVVAQPKRIRRGTMRLRVGSLPLLSELRIQHCCGCGVGRGCSSD